MIETEGLSVEQFEKVKKQIINIIIIIISFYSCTFQFTSDFKRKSSIWNDSTT
jgi:hypothetical protein